MFLVYKVLFVCVVSNGEFISFQRSDEISKNMTSSTQLRDLYAEIEPYDSGHLQVSDIHRIYYEESGNKQGKPVIYV